jgi:hypothetical protein
MRWEAGCEQQCAGVRTTNRMTAYAVRGWANNRGQERSGRARDRGGSCLSETCRPQTETEARVELAMMRGDDEAE